MGGDASGPLQRRPHQRARSDCCTPELIQRNAFAGIGFGEKESCPRFGLIEARDEANGRYPSVGEIKMIGVAH